MEESIRQFALTQVDVLIRQTAAWLVFAFSVTILSGLRFAKNRARVNDDTISVYDRNAYEVASFVLAIIFVVALFMTGILATHLYGYIANPEWYAIQHLLRLVR